MDFIHKMNQKISPNKVVEAAKLSLPPRNKIFDDLERKRLFQLNRLIVIDVDPSLTKILP